MPYAAKLVRPQFNSIQFSFLNGSMIQILFFMECVLQYLFILLIIIMKKYKYDF